MAWAAARWTKGNALCKDARGCAGSVTAPAPDGRVPRRMSSGSEAELQAWSTSSECSDVGEEAAGEEEEDPPLLPGVVRTLGSFPMAAADPVHPEHESTVAFREEEVLQLRREVQAVEALARFEAIELEWLRSRARVGPSEIDAVAKSTSGGEEGAEQRRRRLALETIAKLKSAPRPIAERTAAIVVPSTGEGPRLNRAAALRQQRAAETRKAPEARSRLGTSTEWRGVAPRYLNASASRGTRSPARPSRDAVSSSPQRTGTTVLARAKSAPRSNRSAQLRQQHRERTDAIPSHEEALKDAAIRARKSYLKPPPGLDLAAPSPRSAQMVDTIFDAMDRHKVRAADLVAQFGVHGAVSAKGLKAAFGQHGVELTDAGVQALMRAVDINGDGKIDVRDFIEQMRRLKGARSKLPGDVEVFVPPDMATRVNSCGVESRKLAAVRLKLKAHSYSTQDPAKVFHHFGRANTGSLELAEFTAAVRKLGRVTVREIADEELRKLFESFDLDGTQKLCIADLMGFVFGNFDLIEEKSSSGVRLSQNSPVRTPREARRQAKTVADEVRMQRLGASPSHWAVEVIGARDAARTRSIAPATMARHAGSRMVVADDEEEVHAAARSIQAAARGMIARQPPALPFESDSDEDAQSDNGTRPTARTNSAVAGQTAHLRSQPVNRQPSVSPVVSRSDAEIGYGMVLKIAEEARRRSPPRNAVPASEASKVPRCDQSIGWSPTSTPSESPQSKPKVAHSKSQDTTVSSVAPVAEGLQLPPPSSESKKANTKEPIKPMTHREWKAKQAESRASVKARAAARRQQIATNVSFDEAVERVRSCLSCQLRSSVVNTVSYLLREDAQQGSVDSRRGRYVPVTQVEHLLRSWSREWQSASHDGKPLHGFDSSMVRVLSHHLVKTCYEDQTRLAGFGLADELRRLQSEEATEANKSSVMIQ